jgi:hypothetical protein
MPRSPAEAAAGRGRRDVDVVGQGHGEGFEPVGEAEVVVRTPWVKGGGWDLFAHLQSRGQLVVGPGDGVEDLELGEALGVLLAEDTVAGIGDRAGSGGGVAS